MFDAIAPRYDLVNRIMTFRLDVRWRRRAVRDLRLPAGSTVLDLASGTGDLCVDLRKAGHRPISIDLSYGMLAADRSGAPRVQGDILRLPVPDASVDGVTCGFALRNLTDLAAFFQELGRVVRPGGRIALLDVGIPRNKVIRFGNDIYFGKIVPKIGALLSDGAAYRYLPKSVAYLPAPDEMVSTLRRGRFRRRLPSAALRGPDPAPHRHTRRRPLMIARTVALESDVDLNDVAGGDGYLFVREGAGFAGRGVAARVPVDEAVDFLAAIEHVDEVGGTNGPIALGALPFLPGAEASLVVPSVVVGKDSAGGAWVTRIDGDDQPLRTTSPAGAERGVVPTPPARAGRPLSARLSPPPAMRCERGRWTRP